MSLDNVLALAGASGGDMTLLVFGLALSIPLVMFAMIGSPDSWTGFPWSCISARAFWEKSAAR